MRREDLKMTVQTKQDTSAVDTSVATKAYLALLANKTEVLSANPNTQAISTQEIIQEFTYAITNYLQETSASEEMLLDALIINKAKILEILSKEIIRQQQSRFTAPIDPLTIFQQTVAKMPEVNAHKSGLLESYLKGQINSKDTIKTEPEHNSTLSTT
jgi:hypothetical protein